MSSRKPQPTDYCNAILPTLMVLILFVMFVLSTLPTK